MEDINNEKVETKKSTIPKNQVPIQQNPVVQLATAINQLSARLNNLEIDNIKIKADIEIGAKVRDLLSKRLDFAFDKIDSLEG